jgi:hypothetical protein
MILDVLVYRYEMIPTFLLISEARTPWFVFFFMQASSELDDVYVDRRQLIYHQNLSESIWEMKKIELCRGGT